MRLFHIAIFMSDGHIVFCRLHAIMAHECSVSHGPIFWLCLACIFDGGAQLIGAMLRRDTTDLPQRFFDPLCQSLKRFAKTDGDGFHIGVREHKMMHPMWERNVSNRDI